MNLEQSFFIDVLKDFINKQNSEIPEKIDWSKIEEYAHIHCVEGVFYKQTHHEAFSSQFIKTIYVNVQYNEVLKLLKTEFEGISYIIFKGPVIANYYPVPELRAMSDIDLLVEQKDKNLVHNKLTNLGFMNKDIEDNHEWIYKKDSIVLEIHDKLFFDENVILDSWKDYFSDVWQNKENEFLNINYHFVYILAHMAKHFMNSGIGFRHFIDIAVLLKYEELNWIWILNELKKIRLYDFSLVIGEICYRWFSVNSPLNKYSKSDLFFEEATNRIFENGIWGFENQDNCNSYLINDLMINGKRIFIKRFKHKLFPSYKELCLSDKYSFVYKKPLLVPFVWLYRLLFNLLKKENRLMLKEAKKYYYDDFEIEKRKKIYKDWGL